jgi:hypothetical protein
LTPTNELRFVERETDDNGGYSYKEIVQVLQQKWIQNDLEALAEPRCAKYEWRDVPVVKESK